jgi:uncharacterized Ntn-hydrolase superfamily protein
MRKLILPSIYILIFHCTSLAQFFKKQNGLSSTYSIVARDSVTGEMAVAVQSHWFSVGTAVSWGEAGVGVIATQSFTNKSFGMRGLELLKQGKTPQEALELLLKDDPGKAVRQVAILDSKGQVASHTGKGCIDAAGHTNGVNFSVQANMMLNDKVWPAMVQAWMSNQQLQLAERMIEVLKAGQAAGGDIRGKQSAVLMVFRGTKTDAPWDDKLLDLRVDDASEPIKEIDRLLKVHRAYEHMNNGDLYTEKGDMENAMKEYNAAMKMFPGNLEMQYWTAITMANNKKVKEASAMLKKVYAKDANWLELTRRLPKVGLLNVSENEFKELTKR